MKITITQVLILVVLFVIALVTVIGVGVMVYTISGQQVKPVARIAPTSTSAPTATVKPTIKVELPTRVPTATRVPTPTEAFDEECSPEIMKAYADVVIIYSDYMINEQLIYFRKVEVPPVRYVSAAFNVGDIAVEFQNNEVPDCPETIALWNATIDWFKTMTRIAKAQGMGEKNQYSTMTLEDLEPKMNKVAEEIARITLLQ